MHDGKKHMLKPMADSAIIIEMQVPERKVVQKIDLKLRMVSLQGREDDAGKTPLIDNSTKVEPFDESRHEKVAENNAKHMTRLCRGNDGRVRQLCGPKIASVFGKKLMHVDPYHTVHVSIPSGMYNKRSRSDAKQEPKPEDIIPTFRPPPKIIRIGSCLFKLQACN